MRRWIPLVERKLDPRDDYEKITEELRFLHASGLPLAELLERYCAGCVVTEREHRSLGRGGVLENPWLRYARDGIRLAANSAWTEPHRSWIAAADLVEPEAPRRSA